MRRGAKAIIGEGGERESCRGGRREMGGGAEGGVQASPPAHARSVTHARPGGGGVIQKDQTTRGT